MGGAAGQNRLGGQGGLVQALSAHLARAVGPLVEAAEDPFHAGQLVAEVLEPAYVGGEIALHIRAQVGRAGHGGELSGRSAGAS